MEETELPLPSADHKASLWVGERGKRRGDKLRKTSMPRSGFFGVIGTDFSPVLLGKRQAPQRECKCAALRRAGNTSG